MGSQYLRIIRAPAIMAATTPTTGQAIAPKDAAMVDPAILKPVASRPAPAISILIPAITGHITSPTPPSTATRPVTAPATRTIFDTSSGLAFTQTLSRSIHCVAVCVSFRRLSSAPPNTFRRSPENAPCNRSTSPDRLSRSVLPISSAAPLTSPSRFFTPASAPRNFGIWSTDKSSTGVPNRAIAALARSAGFFILSRPRAVFCIATRAFSPPLAIAADIFPAFRPIC